MQQFQLYQHSITEILQQAEVIINGGLMKLLTRGYRDQQK